MIVSLFVVISNLDSVETLGFLDEFLGVPQKPSTARVVNFTIGNGWL